MRHKNISNEKGNKYYKIFFYFICHTNFLLINVQMKKNLVLIFSNLEIFPIILHENKIYYL